MSGDRIPQIWGEIESSGAMTLPVSIRETAIYLQVVDAEDRLIFFASQTEKSEKICELVVEMINQRRTK